MTKRELIDAGVAGAQRAPKQGVFPLAEVFDPNAARAAALCLKFPAVAVRL